MSQPSSFIKIRNRENDFTQLVNKSHIVFVTKTQSGVEILLSSGDRFSIYQDFDEMELLLLGADKHNVDAK